MGNNGQKLSKKPNHDQKRLESGRKVAEKRPKKVVKTWSKSGRKVAGKWTKNGSWGSGDSRPCLVGPGRCPGTTFRRFSATFRQLFAQYFRNMEATPGSSGICQGEACSVTLLIRPASSPSHPQNATFSQRYPLLGGGTPRPGATGRPGRHCLNARTARLSATGRARGVGQGKKGCPPNAYIGIYRVKGLCGSGQSGNVSI